MYVAAMDVPSYAPDEAPFLLSRPISGVDIPLAKTILDWNMKRQVPLTAAIVLRLIDNLPSTDIQTVCQCRLMSVYIGGDANVIAICF